MAKKDLLPSVKEIKNGEVSVLISPLKLDKLTFTKKDSCWRAKMTVNHVEKMHDSLKARITLNPAPFEEAIDRLQREITRAEKEPDLFDNSELKELKGELKEEQANMKEKIAEFGEIKFTTTIESLAQKDNMQTGLVIFIPRETIADFMEKINHEADNNSQIEFYI